MSLKEAKKIIDSSKDKLHLTIARDMAASSNISHQTQSSISTTGAVNNFYKGNILRATHPNKTVSIAMLSRRLLDVAPELFEPKSVRATADEEPQYKYEWRLRRQIGT